VVADPKDARQLALRWIELARKARSPELKHNLIERAQLAVQRATGLGRNLGELMGFHPASSSVGRDDSGSLRDQLETANRQLAEGERIVAGWRDLIAESEALGRDTAKSRELLSTFEADVERYRASRDRLRRSIDEQKV
jgi:hypothetical protein